MSLIKPQDFEVSEALLRCRLELEDNAKVKPYGIERLADKELIDILKSRYTFPSLYFRTSPDYIVYDDDPYLVEAKLRSNYVEAIQLFFNKQLEKIGIKVVYSFAELAIRADLIPIKKIVISSKYKKEFDMHLKYVFESDENIEFEYIDKTRGSGDPFVPIDVTELRMLSKKAGV